jgi:hypothetical protein
MATVYLADDIKHERKVALKVLGPELAHAGDRRGYDSRGVAWLGRAHRNSVSIWTRPAQRRSRPSSPQSTRDRQNELAGADG